MQWLEFKQMLIGIGPDTALGRVVAIRSENDEETLKHFTPDQRRIRREWMERKAKEKTEAEAKDFLEQMRQTFIRMAGGGENQEDKMQEMREDPAESGHDQRRD